MSTVLEFWALDGARGEKLIKARKGKILDLLADCVLATMHDTRNQSRETWLWVKPGYCSSTIGQGKDNL